MSAQTYCRGMSISDSAISCLVTALWSPLELAVRLAEFEGTGVNGDALGPLLAICGEVLCASLPAT